MVLLHACLLVQIFVQSDDVDAWVLALRVSGLFFLGHRQAVMRFTYWRAAPALVHAKL
jgi:hypothetical protein